MVSLSSGLMPWGPTGPAGLSSLPGLALPGRVSKDRRTLVQAAVEVETDFLTLLLANLRKSLVQSLASSKAESGSGYQSLAEHHLAKAMALGGGLGLSRWIFLDLGDRISGAY
jgi:Rod binding domain-containing protein|uniref:Flagellar protein FlgJ N-terminal domain-containing protein n=1 Tax=Desulfobacca acetoxidans TaxID=60893 RepID=A0A7C3WK78_9BACT